MREEYSLSYYRTNNIIEPITKEQEGFFFVIEETKRQICELQRLIMEDVYGCYLISGMKGVGKTSFINMVLSNSDKNPYQKKQIIIRLNAVQINNVKDLFSVLIKELLYIVENSAVPLKEFYLQLKEIDILNNGSLKTRIHGENELEFIKGISGSVTKEIETGVSTECIPKIPFKFNSALRREDKVHTNKNITTNTKSGFEYVRQEQPYELFRKLLNDFEDSKYRLIIVLDEIDKCEDTFVKEVFSQYKDFLTNYKLFCFFVTDEKIYRGYIPLRDNLFSTYFVKKTYLPLMSYEETMRYCFEHYCEESICNVDILYYMSLGNTRVLNIIYKTHMYINFFKPEFIVFLYKARMFRYIMDNVHYKFDLRDVKNLKIDMLKGDIKALIEYIFDGNGCSIEEVTDYYNSIKTNRYPEIKEILDWMKKYNDDLERQILNITNEEIRICYDHHACVAEIHDNQIGIKELFPYYEDGMKPCSRCCGSIQLIKLGNNEPGAYENAMEHVLISNYFDIYRLILIRRVREGRPGWYSDEEYSILAIINTGIGRSFAYYNEAGSYSSEGSSYVMNLLKKMETLGVAYSEKLFSNGQNMEEILSEIINDLE